ncbi:unnamed protein product [Durusdinium trenchii]|uniref:Protein kinase domain-containing protein n=2 Tax=Durusdinium trenchii TaxID=1381693 RepID=A0ABP0IXK6_9DINO
MVAELRFATDEGAVLVSSGQDSERSRVHCIVSGAPYDLRRLTASPRAGGGLVALETLESVQREVDFAQRAGRHPNIVRCHGTLVQNEGAVHCRLLLCEPCVIDLTTHTSGSSTPRVPELTDLGQQLAFGLGHLHNLGILYGGFEGKGIFRGHDGLWKLGAFGRAAALPAPPEARGSTDDALKPEADVWLLGAFLSSLLSGLPQGSGALALAPQRLSDLSVGRLWVLLHWLMAEAPEERPCAGEAAALLGALAFTPPQELLAEMPSREHRWVCGTVLAAARQLAVDLAVAEPSELAEMPLERLRTLASEINDLLENCGLDASFRAHDAPEPEKLEEAPPCTGFRPKQSADIADASTNASGMSDEFDSKMGLLPAKGANEAHSADLLGLG